MFEQLSYSTLQGYWWLIISILGATLVFMMFVLGGQTLIYTLGKKEPQLSLIIKEIRIRWDLTFTNLVVFCVLYLLLFHCFIVLASVVLTGYGCSFYLLLSCKSSLMDSEIKLKIF